MTDARFEDGQEGPLRLRVMSPDDLPVLATLTQDAVFSITEMRFVKERRRFAVMLNRFRWEDREAADRERRPYERVQALASFENVLAVRSQGIDRAERDTVLSVLDITYDGPAEGPGVVTLVLAGDGAVALQVEALEMSLRDTSRPYKAVSGKAPVHE